MPTFGFWNIRKSVPAELLGAFAHEQSLDVLVLAENVLPGNELARSLTEISGRLYFADPVSSSRVAIFTRFPVAGWSLVSDEDEVSCRRYSFPHCPEILLAAVHLPSKLYRTELEQSLGLVAMAQRIRENEQRVGHKRTMILGDLNMNPFEPGVVGSAGLHGIMDRRIVAAGGRVVAGDAIDYFYNPMWSLLGDLSAGPPGTYFYNSGSPINYFWNCFDQVLVRPALVPRLATTPVTVVTEISGQTLQTNQGRPSKKWGSDHFPIVCRIQDD